MSVGNYRRDQSSKFRPSGILRSKMWVRMGMRKDEDEDEDEDEKDEDSKR